MKETVRGEEFTVSKKNHPTGMYGYKPKSKEPVAGSSPNSEENQLIVEEKLHVHQQTSRKMLSVCV